MFGLSTGLTILLITCIVLALAFEFINGFHDTANAVATVIFTRSLKPGPAVILSGIMNFCGVYLGGIAVAMGIINLLPMNVLVDQNITLSLAMVLSLIITATIWNLGTWWFGLPCSSSHTLIGSIFGVGLAYSFLPGNMGVALNWHKVQEVLLSLLISPVIGFGLSFGLIILLKKILEKDNKIFDSPKQKEKPPVWIRWTIIGTSALVSLTHGSNDGQKGVGLIMIILIVLLPFNFAIDSHKDLNKLNTSITQFENVLSSVDTTSLTIENRLSLQIINSRIDRIQYILNSTFDPSTITKEERVVIRKEILLLAKEFDKVTKSEPDRPKINFESSQLSELKESLAKVKGYTEYAPPWVIFMVSLALGLGTMIGWKRIVMTIGTKIGKSPLTYAQGAASSLVAASTIWMSSLLGLPVSTTHVLSSGIAGTMVAKKRKGNLKLKSVRNIAIAWLITLPITIVMSAGIFVLLWFLIK